jgi:TIR domain-containing protein
MVKLFISWSGERSKLVATALRHWLPDVIQSVEPWMSGADLEAGTRWNEKIQTKLSESRFGILCLTQENINSPWILFEAGALAKTLEDTFVCPYLIDLRPVDLPQGPLAQFQAKQANLEETRDLVGTINRALGDQKLDEQRVERGFERCWPDLDRTLRTLPEPATESRVPRNSQSILEEILLLVRRIEAQARPSVHEERSQGAGEVRLEAVSPRIEDFARALRSLANVE